jgi:hypothetical protein
MKYIPPQNVTGPQDYISSVTVLYDGQDEGFSIAKIVWEDTACYGIRWNIARREWDDPEKVANKKTCVGMPSSHGYPVWFILPNELLNPNSEYLKKIQEDLLVES